VAEFQALQAGDPRQVGRYRVLARLGAGGMGRVFLARSPGGRPVAVKVVREELAEDPEFRRRFAREVAAARRVNGFFTAGVVDADPEGVEGSPPWLATAYVAGLSLIEAVRGHGPWPEASVRALGAGLAEALEVIHAAGVVHRDLKPSNVLLAPDGPRVIDFGISLAAENTALTQTGAMVGTPGFMSPEQLTGGDVGPASDVFALGAVVVYAATGGGPFGEGAGQAVNFRAAYEPPELGGVPPGLRELAARCLEKDPAGRPGVGELLQQLAGEAGEVADGALPTLEWLPGAVARAVREQSETPLPATPATPATPPSPPPQPTAPPSPPTPPTVPPAQPLQPAQTPLGTFGPPSPSPVTAPAPGRAPSRRGLLAAAAGGTAALAGVGVLAWRLTSDGGSDGGDGGDTGGDGGDGGDGSAGDPDGGISPSGEGDGQQPVMTVGIAVQAPLTGDNAALGQDIAAAVQLAVDEANQGGGYPGLRFEYVAADDQGVEGQATVAAQLAIDDERVLAVVGPAFSGPANVAAPLYSEAGLPAVTPSATNPTLTEQGFETFLRAVPNDRQAGWAIGDFLAAQQEAGSVMVIDDATPYGADLADGVVERLDEAGVEVSRETVPSGSASYESAARTVNDSGADAVAYLGYYADAGPFAVALAEAGFTGIRISGDGVMDAEFVNLAGAAAEGWYVICGCFDASYEGAGPGFQDFAQRYEDTYGEPPGVYGPRAYDVAVMIIEAVAALDQEPDRAAVFEALAHTVYDGVTGEISFDDNGEFTGVGPNLYQVDGGEFAPLGPP
jgi:ABC-type branched-subunit amino acid transport system substrate-binding protein/serine/threonine protein kinase